MLLQLTGFQRDVLYVIANQRRPHGTEIRDELAEFYGTDVGRSRVYRNLSQLSEMDLVVTRNVGRKKEYALSSQGRTLLRDHDEWCRELAREAHR